MLKKLKTIVLSSNPQAVAGAFRRVGWTGFWLQVVLGVLPIILLFYVVFFSGSNAGQRESIALTTYLSVLGWLILFFTTFWSYRYTRLSKKMADPDRCPPKSAVNRILQTGLVASILGILVSMVLMASEVARLLYVFLRAPQGGVPVMQTQVYDPSSWISAIDMVGLMADLSVLAAEIIVMMLTLWLLYRMSRPEEITDESRPEAASAV